MVDRELDPETWVIESYGEDGPRPVERDGAQTDVDAREIVLYGIGRHRWLIAALAVLGAAAGAAYALTLPNQYMSIGKILLQPGQREALTAERAMAEDPFQSGGSRTVMGDELELLDNPEVHRRVAAEVGPGRVLAPYEEAAVSADAAAPVRLAASVQRWIGRAALAGASEESELLDAAAAQLAASTTITSPGHTSTIHVLTTAPKPDLAKELADAYLRVARAKHDETFAPEVQARHLQTMTDEAEERAAEANAAWAGHRQECGIQDVPTERSSLLESRGLLELENDRDRIRLEQLDERLEALTRRIQETPATSVEAVAPNVMRNPEYERIARQIETLTADLAEVERVYRPGTDAYESRAGGLRQRISDLQARLDGMEYFVQHGVLTEKQVPNPQVRTLEDRLFELESEREELQAAVAARDSRLRGLNDRLERMLECEHIHARLEREVRLADAAAEELRSALDRVRRLGSMDRDAQLSNLRIIQWGSMPLERVGPRRSKYVLLGLFGGLFAGLALALGRQALDPRVRYPDHLEERLGVRLLAVVPEVPRWRRDGRRLGQAARARRTK